MEPHFPNDGPHCQLFITQLPYLLQGFPTQLHTTALPTIKLPPLLRSPSLSLDLFLVVAIKSYALAYVEKRNDNINHERFNKIVRFSMRTEIAQCLIQLLLLKKIDLAKRWKMYFPDLPQSLRRMLQ